jgi:hypothetical protein
MAEDQVRLDWARAERLGFDEAILCARKSTAQLTVILEQAAARGASLLLTRLTAPALTELPAMLQGAIDYDAASATGFFAWQPSAQPAPAQVAIVTAGSSDAAIAREAARTLHYYRIGLIEVHDVGVAGIWRLLERVESLRALPVVIAVAGMDAALPSVLGGLVPGLVIAVPTSTGYGVARAGETALHAALVSCAPGLVVCNIDNGYGAACAALRVLGRPR